MDSDRVVCKSSVRDFDADVAIHISRNGSTTTGSFAGSFEDTTAMQSSIRANMFMQGRPESFNSVDSHLIGRSEEGVGLGRHKTSALRSAITASDTPLRELDDPSSWVVRHHEAGLINRIERKQSTYSHLFGGRKRDQKADDVEAPDSQWRRPDENSDFRISFAELQRMKLRKIQCKLVKHVADMRKTGGEPRGWEEDLEAYSKY